MSSSQPARMRLRSPLGQVTAYYPTEAHTYFRLVWHDPETGRRRYTSAGRELTAATEQAEDLERKLLAADVGVAQARTFSDLVQAYVDPERPKSDVLDHRGRSWSHGYSTHINRRAQRIRERIGTTKLELVTQRDIYALVNAEATYHQAHAMRTTLRAVVGFGVAKGYLRPEQSNLAKVDIVVKPGARHRLPTPVEQGEDVELLSAAEVPTLEAVAALATAPVSYPHWEGLVEVLAYCGPRIHEALALTDADVLTDARHLMPRLRIARQLVELSGGGLALTPPKNGHARTVSIISTTGTRFELADWLTNRAEEARTEHAGSDRPALLFPSPRAGTYWRLRNLRKRLFVPAAEHAGWDYTDVHAPCVWLKDGGLVSEQRTHRAWTHTLHSLRHFFATTAIDDWDWRDAELCQAGGWQSEGFVRRRYYGRTTEVTAAAQSKQLAWLSRRIATESPAGKSDTTSGQLEER